MGLFKKFGSFVSGLMGPPGTLNKRPGRLEVFPKKGGDALPQLDAPPAKPPSTPQTTTASPADPREPTLSWWEHERRAFREMRVAKADSELEAFLAGVIIEVISSNVWRCQFVVEEQTLYVQYRNGNWYWYTGISEDEATQLYHAGSKGKWVWDCLRVRGTVFGHKKPYGLFQGGMSSGTPPKYTAKQEWLDQHGAIPPAGDVPHEWLKGNGPYHPDWAAAAAPAHQLKGLKTHE